MVPISTQRLQLRRAYAKVPATFTTLLLALQDEAFRAADAVKGGTISNTSRTNGAGGQAVSFSNRDNGSTPEDISSMWGEMLDLYDASRAGLVAAGIASLTDAQVYAEMLNRLQSVTSFTKDYGLAMQEGCVA